MKYQIIDNLNAGGYLEGIYTFEELKARIKKFVQEIAENDYDYCTTGDYTMPEVETLDDIIYIIEDDDYRLEVITEVDNLEKVFDK